MSKSNKPSKSYAQTVATAKAKVGAAEHQAYAARAEAIAAILVGADEYDVMMLCADALAQASPLCCETHKAEFRTEVLRLLDAGIAALEEEADEHDGDDKPRVH